MQHSSRMYLSKIQEMCVYLLSRIESVTRQEYLQNQDLQFAMERAFIVLGEAMTLLKKHDLRAAAVLEPHMAAIGLRNLLVHRYWDIDNREVWSTLTQDVAPLKDAVDTLLEEIPSKE